MRHLINFLIRYSTWFVFAFYVVVSCILLFKNNSYQQSIYLTSANAVSSSIYGVRSDITSYIGLRTVNEELQARNADLTDEVLKLRQELKKYQGIVGDTADDKSDARFDYILATVLNNSTRHPRNYFSIDKGYKDGVHPGMGVVDHNGIIGIVNVAGAHTARVISVLNVTQPFSVKLMGTSYFGMLTWHGTDPSIAYVEEIPKHVRYKIGQKIITSGNSTAFPEGISIGTVMGQVRTDNDNFVTLKVRLSSDFSNLSNVRVIKDILKGELDNLAKYDNRDMKNKSNKD